ncbi:MAG: DUF1501 domain-containing protein [Bacteroidota bacterium]
MKNTTHNKRHGSALEHGQAHTEDHDLWSRRSFLRNFGLVGGASMLLGKLPVTAMESAMLSEALRSSDSDRILVLIRLKGGNDGLNTIIPLYDYDTYANFRPTVRLRQNETIRLTDEFAMHGELNAVEQLWEEDAMRIINSVGYPNQNLSHFRSTDIWSSASDANVLDSSGWLGRYLGDLYPDYLTNPPSTPPAIQIGGFDSLVFNDLNRVSISVNIADPRQLEDIAENGQLYDINNLPDCTYGEQLRYMRTVANSTFFYADDIGQAANRGRNTATYPEGNPLASSLATVARLIKGNMGTQLYMVTMDGFDTHANQANQHARLMRYLGEAVKAFYDDLEQGGWQDKVLSMTFSEFGRRPRQNAADGTDHGAAAPVLLFGEGLNGSMIQGGRPDLNDLDQNDNIKYDVDFRDIYATILDYWLCIPSDTVDQVIGRVSPRLNLGFDCQPTSVTSLGATQPFRHRVLTESSSEIILKYELPSTAQVRVDVVDVMGRSIQTLQNGRQVPGQHQLRFSAHEHRIPNGQYFYRIQADQRRVSGAFQIMKN